MSRPVLHPVRVAQRTLYWVGDYPLFLRRDGQGWGIHAAPSRIECRTWLKERNLLQQRFDTRKEALRILLWALEQDSDMEPDPIPKIIRDSEGGYRTTAGWSFRPAPGGWDVYDPQGNFQKNSRGSLWRALWMVDILSGGVKEEDDWPDHLYYDRTARGVHEGSDRSPRHGVD